MKKRVLHLLSTNNFSGAENVACTIIQNNKDVESFYCSPDGKIKNILNEKGINYIPIKKLSYSETKKIVKEYKIDVIHAHDYKASFVASFFGNKIPVISHIHCEPDFSKKWNIFTLAYLFVSKRFAKIIMVSKESYNNVVFNKKLNNKMCILLNIVNVEEIKKKACEFKVKDYDLVFVGRLTDVKNPLLLFDILQEVKKDKDDISLCIVGNGDLMDKCKKKVSDYKLENNVDFVGFQTNPFPYVKSSKIELITSKSEGIPMSVIEALSLSIPVLNNGSGGLKNIFEQHPELICHNIQEYKEKIIEFLEKDMSKECESICQEYIDVENYIKKLNKIYNGE